MAKGKLTDVAAAGALGRVHIAQTLGELADCDLVIEAIIERLDAKQALFQALEAVVSPQCVLVSNTSSLSITAIASACAKPARVAGYHFLTPFP